MTANLDSHQMLLQQAQIAGIPVIQDHNFKLDPSAVRAVPEELGVIGTGYHEGYIVIAFQNLPKPLNIEEVKSQVGMPIKVAVAPETIFQSLWEQSKGLRNQPLALTEHILESALSAKASDIHLSVGIPPMLRVGGILTALEGWNNLSAADLREIANYVAPEADLENFNGDLDVATTYGNFRFRTSLYYQQRSLAVAMRSIPSRIPNFNEMGLPDVISSFANLQQGLVLVCGPTGSGKSTTLAMLIDQINDHMKRHIITIEDPIEYVHASKQSIIHQREVGEDTKTFNSAMKSVLRQDPDIILVGAMRDFETISTALTAAETGHLVFSTLHSTDAKGTIDRIIDVFPTNQQEQIRVQLAATISGIVCQSLLPSQEEPGKRVPIVEVMVATSGIRALIREGGIHQIPTALQSGIQEHGMIPRDLSLAKAVAAGQISDRQAKEWASDIKSYNEYITKFR